ncbi:M14 family metallopeptidase [Roseivirga sp.]|uniref:M14 family metallopeptidase n=1 Tax=Roseivirga sp. TaxID=1964215 RepID=UPI003B8AA6D4
MKRYSFLAVFCFLSVQIFGQAVDRALLITPEKTNYTQTSTYQDVIDFTTLVTKNSPYVTKISMGTSLEGRDIPVFVLANPKIETAAEAKASGKPIIYVQGNIHSGEVEGKEAVQILMRDILTGDKKHLIDNQIILFVPIYNTDSNDKMDEEVRRSQEGSPLKTGKRSNSQGWDLNRDGMKMETLESNALIQNIIVPWDPTLFVDLHTTNGTWHGYSLTWAPSYHTAGEKAPYDFTWDRILPEVSKNVLEKNNVHLGPYGYYYTRQEGWPIKSISTYNHHPRYLVNQFGLRNRMAILSEAFAHERLYQRINATHSFVAEILEFTNKNGQEMLKINAKAEADAIALVENEGGKVQKGVRFKKVPLDKPIASYRTYNHMETTNERGQKTYLRKPEIVELKNIVNYSGFEATKTATLPKGYIIPKEFADIAQHLMNHGVEVVELKKNTRAKGEVFTATKLTRAARPFEKHNIATIEGTYKAANKKFGKGDFWVDLAQPLANLIFYLLEPESDDGLVTWNFFDKYFDDAGIASKTVEYPVFKYFEVK